MKEINFIELFNEVTEILSKTKEVVIATSYKDRVTARTVFCICDGIDIYFITSKAYTKYKQIERNTKVALAINDIQVEGIAKILGHPSTEENIYFKTICQKNEDYMDYYKKYSKYKNTVLIKVSPTMITLYKEKGVYKYLNLEEEKAYGKGIWGFVFSSCYCNNSWQTGNSQNKEVKQREEDN